MRSKRVQHVVKSFVRVLTHFAFDLIKKVKERFIIFVRENVLYLREQDVIFLRDVVLEELGVTICA
jgi:hypothetical protein